MPGLARTTRHLECSRHARKLVLRGTQGAGSARYAEGETNVSDDEEFEARLIGWLEMPGEGDPYPHDANPYPADPRDARFDALCGLYLEADDGCLAHPLALYGSAPYNRIEAS